MCCFCLDIGPGLLVHGVFVRVFCWWRWSLALLFEFDSVFVLVQSRFHRHLGPTFCCVHLVSFGLGGHCNATLNLFGEAKVLLVLICYVVGALLFMFVIMFDTQLVTGKKGGLWRSQAPDEHWWLSSCSIPGSLWHQNLFLHILELNKDKKKSKKQ